VGFAQVSGALAGAFGTGDTAELLLLLDSGFDHNLYSLKSLFRDDQHNILLIILQSTLARAESVVRQQYGEYAPLMRFLADLHVVQPKLFRTLAESALNSELQQALKAGEREHARKLIADAKEVNIALDGVAHEFVVRKQLEESARSFAADPHSLEKLQALETTVTFAQQLPFSLNLSEVQNLCFGQLNAALGEAQQNAASGDESTKSWIVHAHTLADSLRLRIE
jgi:hypothetical protein